MEEGRGEKEYGRRQGKGREMREGKGHRSPQTVW